MSSGFSHALTKVIQLASTTFHSRRIPTKDELLKLRSEVGKLKLHEVDETLDLQLLSRLVARRERRDGVEKEKEKEKNYVFCKSIGANRDFEVAIFVLPQGSILPLHDHPNMTVICKVLYGSLHWTGFDWCSPSSSSSSSSSSPHQLPLRRKARKVIDARFSSNKGGEVEGEGEAHIILPHEGGNLHELRALEPTVLFDILAPPYTEEGEGEGEGEGEEEGRGEGEREVRELEEHYCTYYEVEAEAGEAGGRTTVGREGQGKEEGEGEGEGEEKKRRGIFTLRALRSSDVYQTFCLQPSTPINLRTYIESLS